MASVIAVRLAQLRTESVRKGVPEDVTMAAATAARRWARSQSAVSARRLRDYYWATVRRLAFAESTGAKALRQRFVIASMVQDLRSVGFDEARIREEVERYFGAEAAGTCCAA